MLQGCHSQLVELQDDNKLELLVTNLLSLTLVESCQQAVDNLSTSCEQAMRTYPVDKLFEFEFEFEFINKI